MPELRLATGSRLRRLARDAVRVHDFTDWRSSTHLRSFLRRLGHAVHGRRVAVVHHVPSVRGAEVVANHSAVGGAVPKADRLRSVAAHVGHLRRAASTSVTGSTPVATQDVAKESAVLRSQVEEPDHLQSSAESLDA